MSEMKSKKKKEIESELEEIGSRVEREAEDIGGNLGFGKLNKSQIIALVIIGILLLVVIYNSVRIVNLPSTSIGSTGSGAITVSKSASKIIPNGNPAVYGKELGVSFDDVSVNNPSKADTTIRVLGNLDNSITLTGSDLQRYINIASQISCEYCCGAESIIFSNGQAACGCAHSYAMRGLAKYLIKNHNNEYTDDQILEEIGKWKVLFFPDIHIQKAAVLESKGIELSYINLASNKYRGIETGASGGSMVGGC